MKVYDNAVIYANAMHEYDNSQGWFHVNLLASKISSS